MSLAQLEGGMVLALGFSPACPGPTKGCPQPPALAPAAHGLTPEPDLRAYELG